jgi:hypothetical protein
MCNRRDPVRVDTGLDHLLEQAQLQSKYVFAKFPQAKRRQFCPGGADYDRRFGFATVRRTHRGGVGHDGGGRQRDDSSARMRRLDRGDPSEVSSLPPLYRRSPGAAVSLFENGLRIGDQPRQ